MRKIHIVLADDDPDECFLFSEVTTELVPKVELTCLSDCKELLDLLGHSIIPDLIFLDLAMPIQSGQECMVEIRKHPEWSTIPIVVYSTAAQKNIVDECFKVGANLYVIKPSNSSDLKETILQVMMQLIPLYKD